MKRTIAGITYADVTFEYVSDQAEAAALKKIVTDERHRPVADSDFHPDGGHESYQAPVPKS